MPELLAEPLLHGLVAAVVVAALLRVWRLAEPGQRLAFQLLGLACPLLLPPVGLALNNIAPTELRQSLYFLFYYYPTPTELKKKAQVRLLISP